MLAGARENAGAAAQPGWLDRVVARLRGLVTIRRTGDVAGEDAGARIARAETALARDDLAGAVAEMKNLSSDLAGEAGAAVSAWLVRAEARLQALELLDRLDRLALERLTDEIPAPDPPPDEAG